MADRARGADAGAQAAALAEAERAVGAAAALAQEYQDGRRTQAEVIVELRRRFPWLDGDVGGNLAARLGHFGYYVVIM